MRSRHFDSSRLRRVRPPFAGFFMTHRLDVACSRELCERWCALAERRLAHLTELFESGRWRRYYTEHALLENFREAKAAVKVWHALSRGESIGRIEIGLATAADKPVLETPLQPSAEPIEQPIA